ISQTLVLEALNQLGHLAMVKESRARHLENYLIMPPHSNQIR
ncbi:unnamed protein product, partial [Tuber aestivum]